MISGIEVEFDVDGASVAEMNVSAFSIASVIVPTSPSSDFVSFPFEPNTNIPKAAEAPRKGRKDNTIINVFRLCRAASLATPLFELLCAVVSGDSSLGVVSEKVFTVTFRRSFTMIAFSIFFSILVMSVVW